MPLRNILIEGVVLLLAAVGIYEGARLSRVSLLFADPLGPGWYLFFSSLFLFICTGIITVRQWRLKTPPREDQTPFYKAHYGQALLLLVFYAMAASLVGYLAASFFFFLLIQRVFGERSWIRCLIVATAITAISYYGFSYLAGMPLP